MKLTPGFLPIFLLVLAAGTAAVPAAPAQPLPGHVVLVICDGLRPDFVTKERMPTLFALSREGVMFAHNHCVYPSSTEVNGAALATGCFPVMSGIAANREYRPGINPRRAIPTESREAIRGGDQATEGKYLGAATIAELVQGTGSPTAVAGTKGVALLHDRSEDRVSEAAKQSWVIIGGHTQSPELQEELVKALGPFPPVTYPNSGEDTWTAAALVGNAWKTGVPRFSVLWLSDPDYSQHATAPGSETALAALKSCDDRIATVLAALEAKGGRKDTAVFVVSDHGFSTLVNPPDISATLVAAGVEAVPDFVAGARQGQVLVVNLGGSVEFYTVGHDRATTAKTVEALQKSDFAGPIFTREKFEGTFTLDAVRINTPAAPDIVMAYRWTDAPNRFGIPGLILGDATHNDGRGMHASLSKYDLHNTLIAAGPGLKHGFVDELPTGNTDVAPTILKLLGITPKHPVQGRVLREALAGEPNGGGLPESRRVTLKASRKFEGSTWNQTLTFVRFGDTVYFDEGNRGAEEAGRGSK